MPSSPAGGSGRVPGRAGLPGQAEPRELRILNAIAEELNSAPDVQQALDRTLALVTDLLGLPTGWVWLLDPETGDLYCAAVRNLPPYLQQPIRMAGGACWCNELFVSGSSSAVRSRPFPADRPRRTGGGAAPARPAVARPSAAVLENASPRVGSDGSTSRAAGVRPWFPPRVRCSRGGGPGRV